MTAYDSIEYTTRGNYARSVYGQIQWMGRNGCTPRAIEKWMRREIRRLDRRMPGFRAIMATLGCGA